MSALAEFVAYLKSKAPDGLDSQTEGSVDNPNQLNVEGATQQGPVSATAPPASQPIKISPINPPFVR